MGDPDSPVHGSDGKIGLPRVNAAPGFLRMQVADVNGIESPRQRDHDMKSLVVIVMSLAIALSSVATGGCQTPNYQRNGTILGGLGGAGLGAAIGNKSQNALAGGLIGGAVGAIAGNAMGQSIDQDRAMAQQQAYAQGSAQQAVKGAVTPQDVVAMSRAGLSEDVIATHIRANGVTHAPQANDLIYLRSQGVTDGVLLAMQQAPSSQAKYSQAYTAAIPPPPQPSPVVVEHVYTGPAYYCPPPYYWRGYHHHHHHGPPRSNHVHWGFSFGH
jgi:uncharacterized membrane protein